MADSGLLFDQSDWSFDLLRRTHDAIEAVALRDLGLEIYPNQIEIISAEQMLDAYSAIGMPLMYGHWSFGKHFIHHERQYSAGHSALAYEIVINSNPCVSYCLEENTMPMQALVMAHAAFGHNHFFRNNHLFRQWTDAENILDYLAYARAYIRRCEDQHGPAEVERILDAAHALMSCGVFRHRRPPPPTAREQEERARRREAEREREVHYIWSGLDRAQPGSEAESQMQERKREMHLPEENLLYFLERFSPVLQNWQREVLSITRHIAQYFYPQRQTKIMNEGCATFVHYHIMHRLHETGRIGDGAMLEVLANHTNVLTQPAFDAPHFTGLNPYAIGFAMMRDIQRICTDPTEEDREWFPYVAGCGDWRGVLKEAWSAYRDESFIQQFLSPRVIRDLRLFALTEDENQTWYRVSAIHDAAGYHRVRDTLQRANDPALTEPVIQVADVDLLGDRVLHLEHRMFDGVPLDDGNRRKTLEHCRRLWGYDVRLTSQRET
ncbi:SpoVR family protein [Tabrizicola sp.]|uniref:SpoVR family protein n=1 Tax=Tabrizicola sp. TaxID=2005166 RepID=UPI0035B4F2B3